MGEAKRKDARLSPAERAGRDLTHKLANEGKLLEGGFAAFVLAEKITPEHPALATLRDAYMAGAEHLWTSIMGILDPGEEPTDDDMRRAEAIQAEIDIWREKKLSQLAQSMPTKGSA
jgi:hypothetical protein